MKPQRHLSWGGHALALLFLTAALFLQAAELNPETKDQIVALARYTAPIMDDTTSMLAMAGYAPPPAEVDWEAYPAIRKIEAAYHAAEYNKTGQGDQLLAILVRQINARYESTAWSERTQKIIALPLPPEEGPLDFSRPPRGPPPPLPPETRSLIREIARHTESGILGDTHSLLKEYCHLSDDAAHDMVGASASHEDAMLRGFRELDVTKQKDSLRKLYTEISKRTESIAHAAIFASLFRPDPPDRPGPEDHPPKPPGDGPPHRPGGPTFGGGGGGGEFKPREVPRRPIVKAAPPGRGARFYSEVVRSSYLTSTARSFGSMISVRGGFGGVIFGSPVTPPAGDLKVKSVIFKADARDGSYGTLLLALSDGRTAALEGVRSESVGCAVRLLYQSFDGGINPPESGEGIGLAGIKDFVPTVVWNADGKPRLGQKQNAVLHPAMENTNLGWALLGVDSLPIVSEYLVAQVRKGGDEPASRVLARFWANFADAGTWKVTDQPLTISIDAPAKKGGNSIIVLNRTKPDTGTGPLFLGMSTDFSGETEEYLRGLLRDSRNKGKDDAERSRRVDTVIEERTKQQAELAKARGDAFETVLPILVRYCPDYDLVEEFARILSLLRWAKQTGAPLPKLPERLSPPVPTPTAILLHPEKGLEPADAFQFDPKNPSDAYLQELPAFHRAAQSILGKDFPKLEGALGDMVDAGLRLREAPDGDSNDALADRLEKRIEEISLLTDKLKPTDQALIERYCSLKLKDAAQSKRKAE